MSAEQFSNNATTTLGSALSGTATTITVATGTGALFPTLSTGQFFTATLWSAGSTTGVPNEIVRVTARTGDTMTVVRAQEGTTATSWNVGDTFANYPTAAYLAGLANELDVQQQAGNSATDIGTANAGVVTLSPVSASLAALLFSPIRVKKIASANTSFYTLNVDGHGAQAVTFNGATLSSGQLLASQIFEVFWDGTNFELLSTPAVVNPGGPAGGDLSGTYPNPSVAAGAITTPKIASNAVTNAILAQMAANTIKANVTGSAANPVDVTLSNFLAFLGFSQSIGANGALTLPGGLIINWGYSSGPYGEVAEQPPLTTNFPNNCLFAIGVAANPTANISQATWIDTVSLNTNGAVFLVNRESNTSPNIAGFYFLQVGN